MGSSCSTILLTASCFATLGYSAKPNFRDIGPKARGVPHGQHNRGPSHGLDNDCDGICRQLIGKGRTTPMICLWNEWNADDNKWMNDQLEHCVLMDWNPVGTLRGKGDQECRALQEQGYACVKAADIGIDEDGVNRVCTGPTITMRTGRNPQTGKEIKIAAKNVVRFKAGADLSNKVN